MTHYKSVHKFVPLPQAKKSQMQNLQWTRNGRSSRRVHFGNWTKSEARRRVFLQHKETKKVHFATVMDICHLKNVELDTQFLKYKGRVVLQGDIVKDDSGACHKNQGCYCKITRLWRTSTRRSISLHSSNIGGCSQIAQNSKVRMSRRMVTPSTTRVAQNHGQTSKTLCFLLNAICTDTHLQGYWVKDSSRKFCWGFDVKKVPNWESLHVMGNWNSSCRGRHQKWL